MGRVIEVAQLAVYSTNRRPEIRRAAECKLLAKRRANAVPMRSARLREVAKLT